MAFLVFSFYYVYGTTGSVGGVGILFSVLHGTEKSPPLCFGFGFGYTLAFLVGVFFGMMD
jgi:hypothetical protein